MDAPQPQRGHAPRRHADVSLPLPLAGKGEGEGGSIGATARLIIIAPVLDEAAVLPEWLAALQAFRARGALLIVVDGGSRDGTPALALAAADAVIEHAPRGRAAQMNAGAALRSIGALAQADHDDLLLFLHADTRLPAETDRLIADALMTPNRAWGRFDVAFDSTLPGLRMVAWFMNRRSRLTGIATGDQALFVRRAAFDAVGGFPDQPLMEDIELSRRLLRASGRPACLRATVRTSGRRWEKHGLWRTIMQMLRLRLAYFLGMPASRLARQYGYRAASDAGAAATASAPSEAAPAAAAADTPTAATGIGSAPRDSEKPPAANRVARQ